MRTRFVVISMIALTVAAPGIRPAAAQYAPMPNGSETGNNSATAPAPVAPAAYPCPPTCPSASRIKVIVPPPEVVFRCAPAPGACQKEAGECAPATQPEAGRIAFNMNLTMNMGASSSLLSNAGLLALLAGGNSGGLLGGSGGLGGSGLEALMTRALAARAGATPATGGGTAPSPQAELESRMRALTAGIEVLSKRIDQDLAPTIREVNELGRELDQIRKRLDKLDQEQRKNTSH